MKRAHNYAHPDGDDATSSTLAGVLAPFAGRLVEKNVGIYSSDDFKKGIDSEVLVSNADLLEKLVAIDSRGGFFAQQSMEAAVLMAINSASLRDLLQAKTLVLHKPLEEVVALIAYKLRVMLAHVRTKWDSIVPGSVPPSGFEGIFAILEQPQPAWSARKVRRTERLKRRPHPFVHYREQDDNDDDNEDNKDSKDDSTIVSKYFDGKAAHILKANGLVASADIYLKGPAGFAIARWIAESTDFQLEVPNSCVHDGALFVSTAGPGPTLKKPAAATTRRPF